MTAPQVSLAIVLVCAGCSHGSPAATRPRDQVTMVAKFESHRPVRVTTVLRVEKKVSLQGQPAVLWDETRKTLELCPLRAGTFGRDALDITFRTVDWSFREQGFDRELACSPTAHGDAACGSEALAASVAWTAHVASGGSVTSDRVTFDQALLGRMRAEGNDSATSLVAPDALSATTRALLRHFSKGTRKVGETWAEQTLLPHEGTGLARWTLEGVDGGTARLRREFVPGEDPGTMAIQGTAEVDLATGWMRSMDEDIQVVTGEGPSAISVRVVLSQHVVVGAPGEQCDQAAP